jgi:Uma2 family endonuclease
MALPDFRYTLEQYLEIERNSEEKHEFFNGQIFAMAGTSPEHATISENISAELGPQLRQTNCRAFSADLRLKIDPTGLYTYPDKAIVCGEPKYEDTKPKTLLNPTLVIEILSDSTEAYDRGDKFAHYRRLESVHEYMLVAQDKMRVEVYCRNGDQWLLTEYSDPNEPVQLASIGCSLNLADVYYNVEFPSEKPGPFQK